MLQCGVPSRIRSDKGGENVDIWDYMARVRGHGRSSYITGSSVHNSRIERLWRDVYSSVISTFSAVFSELESNDVLDPLICDSTWEKVHICAKIETWCSKFLKLWNDTKIISQLCILPWQEALCKTASKQ